MKIDILGLKINSESKNEVLSELAKRASANNKTFITTPYSEFFYRSFRDSSFMEVINSSDYALPDGISVLWLSYFLSIPFRLKSYYGKIFEAIWQVAATGARIIFAPAKLHSVIKEKISGSDFFWDLIALADKEKLRVFLLGGFGDTAGTVAKKITHKFPNLVVSGTLSPKNIKSAESPEIIKNINDAQTDLLLVALGPVKQEKWIAKNLDVLNIKIAIGLGGTFDYIAGKRKSPPAFIRRIGLEWLYRLVTQPRRFKRIWNGTFGLIKGAVRYKVFMSTPFRTNVAGVIISENQQILVAKRNPGDLSNSYAEALTSEHWQFPQGGVDKNEEPEKAMLREMEEEVGLTSLEILGKSSSSHTYTWNNTIRRLWFNRLKYRGQTQTIFYLKYHGNPSDVRIDNREFEDYKWVKKDELKDIIHPVRHKMLDIVLNEIDKYL